MPATPPSAKLSVGLPAPLSGQGGPLAAFEAEIMAFFTEAAELLGVPRSVAAIYAVVFASPVPVSFAGIVARSGVSKGSVSQGLRTLREIGALKEVSLPADKAELFEPDLEMRKLIARYIESRLDRQMKSGRERLVRLERELMGLPAGARKPLVPRLERLQSWHSRSRKLIPVIRTFLRIT